MPGDVGLDGTHGRSPGGTGRLFPDATLPTPDGGLLTLDGYRPRWQLVVVMLGDGSRAEAAERLLAQLATALADVTLEDGRIVAIVACTADAWSTPWPYSFPLAFDTKGQLHRRVAAVDAAGRPDVAVYVTDRYREIFMLSRPGDAQWPASAGDVIDWLIFANIQCPECNPPEP